MGKIVLSITITLDGFMAGVNGELDWHFPHWSNELMEQSLEQLRNTGHLVMGRITYEKMAAHWPLVEKRKLVTQDDREFAERMNRLPKTIFSTTLKRVEWKANVATGDLDHTLRTLKQRTANDVVIWGGVRTIGLCLESEYVDEYRITLIPVFIGRGRALGEHKERIMSMRLLNTRVFANGVVSLIYKRNGMPSQEDLLNIMTGRNKKEKQNA